MSAHTHHGGRLDAAIARFGGTRAAWIDLSTGINPVAWPLASVPVPDWQALPEPSRLAELEAAAAAHFGIDPALCCAVAGSEAGLRLLGAILGQGEGLRLRPGGLTYGTYARAFAPQMPGEAGACIEVLTNPNNPDGRVTPRSAVLERLERCEDEGGWLIVDEAFADAHDGISVADVVAPSRRLVVTRSFGKFFGLAGLRLGFVLAPPELLERLRAMQGDWPVCAGAIAYGLAAYRDRAWIARTREELAVRAERLDAVLARHGLRVRGACPLFRLVETPDAEALFEALARARILTRPFAGHPRLLRLGLPGDAATLGRLEAALESGSARDG